MARGPRSDKNTLHSCPPRHGPGQRGPGKSHRALARRPRHEIGWRKRLQGSERRDKVNSVRSDGREVCDGSHPDELHESGGDFPSTLSAGKPSRTRQRGTVLRRRVLGGQECGPWDPPGDGDAAHCALPRSARRRMLATRRTDHRRRRDTDPCEICVAIATTLLETASVRHALAWLSMVDCCLRPNESLGHHVVLKVYSRYMGCGAIHLNPLEYRVGSKSVEPIESVIACRKWLSRCLTEYIRGRVPGPLSRMGQAFIKAISVLRLDKMKPVLYMGPLTGASIDRLEDRRRLAELRKGSGGGQTQSLRRFMKRALLLRVLAYMPVDDRNRCLACGSRQDTSVGGRWEPFFLALYLSFS